MSFGFSVRKLTCGAVLSTLLLGVSSLPSYAQDQTWQWGGVDQDWDNPANWSGGVVPVKDVDVPEVTDHAIINTDTAGQFPIISATLAGGNPQDIFVGTGAGQVGRLDHTAGTAGTGAGNWTYVGDLGGTGTYNLANTAGTGGTNTNFATGSGSYSTTRMYVGIAPGSSGTLNINTSGTLSTTSAGESFVVGTAGATGSGTVNLDNGTIDSTGEVWIGRDGPGTVNMSGGNFQSDEFFVIGRDGGAVGEFNMTGGNVGASLTNAGSFLVVGSFGGSTGTANVSGGTVDTTAGAGTYIGEGGNGTFNLSGSGILNTNNLRIGLNGGSVGEFSISGSNATVTVDGDLTLGLDAAGADTTAQGTLSFIADASGITSITTMGAVNLSATEGDELSVDLSALMPGVGGHSNILLIDGATSAGEFEDLFQGALAAMDGNGNSYYIDYTVPGDIRLTTAPIFTNQWFVDGGGLFNTASNWQTNTVPTTDAIFGSALLAPMTPDDPVELSTNVSLETVTFNNGNDYIIDSQNGTETLTLSGPAEVRTQAGRHWIRADLVGQTAGTVINFNGGGELVLDGSNNFTGGITVNDTQVSVTNTDAIPAGTTISIDNAGSVRFFGSENGFFGNPDTFNTGINAPITLGSAITIVDAASFIDFNDSVVATISGVVSGEGSIGVQSGSDVTLTGPNTYNGQTNVNSSTLTVSGAGTLGSATGGTVLFNDGTVVLNGVNVGNEGFAISDQGQVQLAGATIGTAPGSALITTDGAADGIRPSIASSGTSTLRSNILAGNAGTGEFVEISSATGGTLTLSGTLAADDPNNVNRTFVFSGAGNTTLTGKIVDLEVDATGTPVAPASNLQNNVSVVKRGSGNLTIGTATGLQDDFWQVATVVEEGTLTVQSNGAGAGELWSRTINVAGTTAVLDVTAWQDDTGSPDYNLQEAEAATMARQALGGKGTVNAGTGGIGVFGDNDLGIIGDGVGTLNITGNLRFKSGGTGGQMNFDLGNSTTVGGTENDLIDVTLATTTAAAAAYQFNITPVENAFQPNGTYRLIRHTGGSTNFTGSTVAILNPTNPDPNNPLNPRQMFSVSGSTGGQVNLVVSGSAANQTWTGSSSNVWDTNNATNWSGTGSVFRDLDNATFNATGSNQSVSVADEVVAGNMTVTGSGANYSFGGSTISAGNVIVSNNAVASFNNSLGGNVNVLNTGTVGGTGTFLNDVVVVSGGTLRVGGAGLPSAVQLGGTLDNFDQYDTSQSTQTTAATGGVWSGEFLETANSQITDLGGAHGQVLETRGGAPWRGAERDLTGTDAAVLVGETQTYFWQVRATDFGGTSGTASGNFYDFMMGLSPDVSNIDQTNAWQDFQVMPFVNRGADTNTAPDNAPFLQDNSLNDQQLAEDQWFNVWVVVNNDATTPTYDLYYSPEGGSATLIASGSTFINDGNTGGFNQDLNAIGFMAAGADGSRLYIDNIHTIGGTVTSDPTNAANAADWGGSVTAYFSESLAVEGDLLLGDGSTLRLDIADSGINDSLDIGGMFSITTGANLEIVLAGGVAASSLEFGDSWDLFDFDPDNVDGAFDLSDITLPSGLSGSLQWDTSSLLTTGVLTITAPFLPGDFNMDTVVDGEDFLVWQRNPAVGSLADWRTNYGMTSSALANTGAVPEPSSLVLMLAAGCGLVRRRKR